MKKIILAVVTNRHVACKKFSRVIAFITAISIFSLSVLAQKKNNPATGQTDKAESLKGITIHQEIDFKASPQRIYETLLSSKQFSDCIKKSFADFTAMSANIEPVVGGAFSVFDGHIIGRNLELIPNQRIVQAWRVVDWPAGVYSIAKFEFNMQGSGTKLIFDHVGFPEGMKDHLATGWQQHYWDALAKYLR